MGAHRVSSRTRCAALAGLGWVLILGMSGAAGGEVAATGFEVSLSSDKAGYRSGEPIALTLSVSNRTGTELRLDFPNTQRFDVAIRDATGNQIWRWSADQLFGQMLGAETIGPARPQIVYRAEFTGRLTPGFYTIEGALVARNRRLSATLVIHVQ